MNKILFFLLILLLILIIIIIFFKSYFTFLPVSNNLQVL